MSDAGTWVLSLAAPLFVVLALVAVWNLFRDLVGKS
jgi:hypothetical protein